MTKCKFKQEKKNIYRKPFTICPLVGKNLYYTISLLSMLSPLSAFIIPLLCLTLCIIFQTCTDPDDESVVRSLTWLALALTSPLLKSSSTTLMSLGASTAARAASMMGVYPALFWWFTLQTSAPKSQKDVSVCSKPICQSPPTPPHPTPTLLHPVTDGGRKGCLCQAGDT